MDWEGLEPKGLPAQTARWDRIKRPCKARANTCGFEPAVPAIAGPVRHPGVSGALGSSTLSQLKGGTEGPGT